MFYRVSRTVKSLQEMGQYIFDILGSTLQPMWESSDPAIQHHAGNLSILQETAGHVMSSRQDILIRNPNDTHQIIEFASRRLPEIVRDVLLSNTTYNFEPDFLNRFWNDTIQQLPKTVSVAESMSGIASESHGGTVFVESMPNYDQIDELSFYRKKISTNAYSWVVRNSRPEQVVLHLAVFKRMRSMPDDVWESLDALDYVLPDVGILEQSIYNRGLWKVAQYLYSDDEMIDIVLRMATATDPVEQFKSLSKDAKKQLLMDYYPLSSDNIHRGRAIIGFWAWIAEDQYKLLSTFTGHPISPHVTLSESRKVTVSIMEHNDSSIPVNTIDPVSRGKIGSDILDSISSRIQQGLPNESPTFMTILSALLSDLISGLFSGTPTRELSTGDKVEHVIQSHFTEHADDIHQVITDNTWPVTLLNPSSLLHTNNTLLDMVAKGSNGSLADALRQAGDAILRIEVALSDPLSLEIPEGQRWKIVKGDPSALYNTILSIAAKVDFSQLCVEKVPDAGVRDILRIIKHFSQMSIYPDFVREPVENMVVGPDITRLLVHNYNPGIWSQAVAFVLDGLPVIPYARSPVNRYPAHVSMLTASVGMLSMVSTGDMVETMMFGVGTRLVQYNAPDALRIASKNQKIVGEWTQSMVRNAGTTCGTVWDTVTEVVAGTQHMISLLATMLTEMGSSEMSEEKVRTMNSILTVADLSITQQDGMVANGIYKGVTWVSDTLDGIWSTILSSWQVSQETNDKQLSEKVEATSNVLQYIEYRNSTMTQNLLDLHEKNMVDPRYLDSWLHRKGGNTFKSLQRGWSKAVGHTGDVVNALSAAGASLMDLWTTQNDLVRFQVRSATRDLVKAALEIELDENMTYTNKMTVEEMEQSTRTILDMVKDVVARLQYRHGKVTMGPDIQNVQEWTLMVEKRAQQDYDSKRQVVQVHDTFYNVRKAAGKTGPENACKTSARYSRPYQGVTSSRCDPSKEQGSGRELTALFGANGVTGSVFQVVNMPHRNPLSEYRFTPTRRTVKDLPTDAPYARSMLDMFGPSMFSSPGNQTSSGRSLYFTPREMETQSVQQLLSIQKKQYGLDIVNSMTPEDIIHPATAAGRSRLASLTIEEMTFYDLTQQFVTDMFPMKPLTLKQNFSHLMSSYMTGMQTAESVFKLDIDMASGPNHNRGLQYKSIMRSELFRFTRSVYVQKFDTWVTVLAVTDDIPSTINVEHIQLSTNLPFRVNSDLLFDNEREQWLQLIQGNALDTDVIGVFVNGELFARPVKRKILTLSYDDLLEDVLLLTKDMENPDQVKSGTLGTMFVSGLRRMVDLFNATSDTSMTKSDLLPIVDAACIWASEVGIEPRQTAYYLQSLEDWPIPPLEDFDIQELVAHSYRHGDPLHHNVVGNSWKVIPSAGFLSRLKESVAGTRTSLMDIISIPGVSEKQILAKFQRWLTEKHHSMMEIVNRSTQKFKHTNANPVLQTIIQLTTFSHLLMNSQLSEEDLAAIVKHVGQGTVGRGMYNIETVTRASMEPPLANVVARGTQYDLVSDRSFLEAGEVIDEQFIQTAGSIAGIIYSLYGPNDSQSTYRFFHELVLFQLVTDDSPITSRSIARACMTSYMSVQSTTIFNFSKRRWKTVRWPNTL